jgi:hypothetical protein
LSVQLSAVPRRRHRLIAMALALLSMAALVTAGPPRAVAAPPTPNFPATIDPYAPNDPQTTCKSAAQKGTMALRDLFNRAYGSHVSYFTRACDEGDTSEHKDGRALDYMLDINNSADKAVADDILGWLLATDKYGNKHANARRLGIMYLIWNRQIWSAARQSEGWRPYSGENPHRDHIHFSLSWDGALQKTTWWTLGEQIAHGTQWGRAMSASGDWDDHAENIDQNRTLTATATAATPDGRLHTINVVPGSGIWYRGRTGTTWDASARKIDDNGNVTSVALVGRPNGTLDVFAVVPGSGIWQRTKPAGADWNASAVRVDTNGSLTEVAATALPNGSVHYAGLLPGSGIWTRSWTPAGGWAANATKVDENPEIASIALTGRRDGTLHLFGVVPDSGIWYRTGTATSWAPSATKIDDNDDINSVAVAARSDGTLHLTGVVSGGGVWYRDHDGTAWTTNAVRIDTNRDIFATSIAALPNNTVYVANLVDVS